LVKLKRLGFAPIPKANRLALAFTPQVNQWNGREEIQLLIHDIQPDGDP
jgi:hypothetical protein